MRKSLLMISVCSAILFMSCKDNTPQKASQTKVNKVVENKEPVKQVVVEETETPKVEVVTETRVEPVKKKTSEYYLIAGCFVEDKNAERLCAKLQREGFPESEILPYFHNMQLVTYKGYADRKEAQKELNRLYLEEGIWDTWVYQLK